MASPEKLFCQYLEVYYTTIVTTLNGLIYFPVSQLRILKALIANFNAIILKYVELRIDAINIIVSQLLDLVKLDTFDKYRNLFCQIAYLCEALRETLTPVNGSDPSYIVNLIPETVRNALRNRTSPYGQFEQYICKLSFKGLIQGLIAERLQAILDEIEELLAKLGTDKIDQWIENYIVALAPFIREMQVLDSFAQCGFETCNFTQTVLNKQEDVGDKLSIQKRKTGWTFKVDSALQGVYAKEAELRQKLIDLRTKLQQPKWGTDGILPENLMIN